MLGLHQHVLTLIGARSVPPLGNADFLDTQDLTALLLEQGLLGFYEQRNPGCPLEVRAALERQWSGNLRLAHLQDEVAGRFQDAGIGFLILKGLPLSERLYDNALIRPCGDIDCLVLPGDTGAVSKILEAAGFRQVSGHASHFHKTFEHPKFWGSLELHSDLSDGRFSFPISEIFSRARPVRVSGKILQIMCPEDELLYLMAHHAHHYLLTRFVWLMDVASFIQRFGARLNWPQLASHAKAWGLRHATWASLSYAAEFFSSHWDAELRRQIDGVLPSLSPGRLTRRMIHCLADPRQPFAARVQRSARAGRFMALCLMDGNRRRLRQIAIRIG